MYNNQITQSGTTVRLHEEDVANLVLAELKRTAEEYTTAILEAQNPQIRHILQTLLQKTLNDQARLFDTLRSLNWYEAPAAAQPQELQKAVQAKQQCWNKLQTFAQQTLFQRQQQMNQGAQQFFS
jgi:spore coat protein CotF